MVVPITDVVKMTLSVAYILVELIIGTPLKGLIQYSLTYQNELISQTIYKLVHACIVAFM